MVMFKQHPQLEQHDWGLAGWHKKSQPYIASAAVRYCLVTGDLLTGTPRARAQKGNVRTYIYTRMMHARMYIYTYSSQRLDTYAHAYTHSHADPVIMSPV